MLYKKPWGVNVFLLPTKTFFWKEIFRLLIDRTSEADVCRQRASGEGSEPHEAVSAPELVLQETKAMTNKDAQTHKKRQMLYYERGKNTKKRVKQEKKKKKKEGRKKRHTWHSLIGSSSLVSTFLSSVSPASSDSSTGPSGMPPSFFREDS